MYAPWEIFCIYLFYISKVCTNQISHWFHHLFCVLSYVGLFWLFWTSIFHWGTFLLYDFCSHNPYMYLDLGTFLFDKNEYHHIIYNDYHQDCLIAWISWLFLSWNSAHCSMLFNNASTKPHGRNQDLEILQVWAFHLSIIAAFRTMDVWCLQ